MVFYMCGYCLEHIDIGHFNMCLHILKGECINKDKFQFDGAGFPLINVIELSYIDFYEFKHKKKI